MNKKMELYPLQCLLFVFFLIAILTSVRQCVNWWKYELRDFKLVLLLWETI